MKKYKSCNDETLSVDLYLNGNIWTRPYRLPIDYYTEDNGLSSVDLVEMLHRSIALSNGATIQIGVFVKDGDKEPLWDWSTLSTFNTYLLTCAELRKLKKNAYIAVNIVPKIEFVDFKYRCFTCNKEALYGNRELMKLFCSTQCHTLFRSRNSVTCQ